MEIGKIAGNEEYPVWDIKEAIKPDSSYTIGVIGSSKSGKTTFLADLYDKINGDFDLKLVMSENIHAGVYDKLKRSAVCFDDWEPRAIVCTHKVNSATDNYFKTLVISDDVVDTKEDRVLKKCLTIYRNANISTVLSVQGWSLIGKLGRGNLHYVVLMKLNSLEEIEGVCEKFLGSFLKPPGKNKSEKLSWMVDWYKRHTSDYNMIVIENINNFAIKKYKVTNI